MGVAYVKINQIYGLKINKNARYELSATLSSDNSIVTPVLFEIKNDDINSYIFSGNIWMLPYEATSKDDSISLTLVEGKKKYKKIAKLILPLKWFPPDTVIHESYPMHQFEENEKKKRKIFADINIHLSTKGTDPFRAPPGQLLVRPMWVNANAPQQQPPVGYIPGQCRPTQFIQPQYNQYPSTQPARQNIQPPIGIPQIRAGPAPQVFTQQFAPPPYSYQGYINPPQPPQLYQNQIQSQQPRVQPNQPSQHQSQITSGKETSSSDDELANYGGSPNVSQKPNPKHNEYTNINSNVDWQPEDYVNFAPVTNNVNQNHNPNSQ